MSDQSVVVLLDELEQLLQEEVPEGEAIAAWRERFEAALTGAERGPDWPGIVARCHALASRVDATAGQVDARREVIRQELARQDQGARALKGYRPS